MAKNKQSTAATRRKFLGGAAVAGVATIAMPQVSRAQTVTLKMQSDLAAKDIFHEYAVDYAKKVNDMAGGRLKIDVLAAGAVVPAFQLIDAVHSGVLDGGHGVLRLLVRQAQRRFAVRHRPGLSAGTPTAARPGSTTAAARRSTTSCSATSSSSTSSASSYLPMPTQPLGWFKKEIKSARRLQGHEVPHRRSRPPTCSRRWARRSTILPGGEIVPAMDRGLIDAAEFNNPSSDLLLGFPDVSKFYMVRQPSPADAKPSRSSSTRRSSTRCRRSSRRS